MKELCKRIGFPDEAIAHMQAAYDTLMSVSGMSECVSEAKRLFFEKGNDGYKLALEEIAAAVDVNKCTLAMVFLLDCAPLMKQKYDELGIDESIYYDTLCDLTDKLLECKRIFGVFGTFVLWWFRDFYTCERFALGRLQFERFPFPLDSYKDVLKKGDTVYKFHVPSGSPLTREAVIDSFRRAYEFYGVEGVMPIYFHSWLIYPPHYDLYADGSNLRAFYELFDIIGEYPKPKNPELWRVFDEFYSPDTVATLPERTSLQRSFKRFILDGNCMGEGEGIVLFDGEKII